MNRSVWPALVALMVLTACTQAGPNETQSTEPATSSSTPASEPSETLESFPVGERIGRGHARGRLDGPIQHDGASRLDV